MNGFAKQTYFDKKLKSINKKVTLNEARHVQTIFLGGRGGYLNGDNGYHFLLVFTPMPNLVTLENSKIVTNWLSTKVSPEKKRTYNQY